MSGPSAEWLARIRPHMEMYDTAGLRVAGTKKAYRAARRDWAGLPEPVFDEFAESGIRLMNEWDEVTNQAGWSWTLSTFIETSVLHELGPHVAVETRGKRVALKALSAEGRQAMAAILGQGIELAENVRETLSRLFMALPEEVAP